MGREIAFFHQLGRTQDIHFFIVEGEPHSEDPDRECFNPMVEQLGLPEILGANIHEQVHRLPWLNRERAYVQLVSKLLDVEFDAIWKRHRRMLIRKTIAWILGTLAVLAALVGIWLHSQPVDVALRVNETTPHNDQLPELRDAVVTLALPNKTETDTLRTMDGEVIFRNVPHKYLGKPVQVTFSCRDFRPVDTTMALDKALTLDIARDPAAYGFIYFRLYDPQTEQILPDVEVTIDGQTVRSDALGFVMLTIPLPQQRKTYPLSASIPLHEDSIYPPCREGYWVFKK